MKAYYKDIWRAIRNNKRRFFSLMVITILGVTMLTGLRAACRDLRYTADDFYDKQGLFDICVVSTLGLTDGDVEALAGLEKIDSVEGTYSEEVKVWIGEQNKNAEVKVLSEQNINIPYLQQGELPQKQDEIAVTENFLRDSGKEIGDTLTIEEDIEEDDEESERNIIVTEYTITGMVIDSMNISSQDEMMAFRSNSNIDYTFFVLPEAVESDIYTAVYMTLNNSRDLICYSVAYSDQVQEVIDIINSDLKEVRQKARYDEIVGEAQEELADAKAEADEEFAKADKEIEDARRELEDGREQLKDGEQELADAEQKIADAEKEIQKGEQELAQKEKELAESEKQLTMIAGSEQMLPGMDIAAMQQQMEAGRAQLEVGRQELEAGRRQIEINKRKLKDAREELEEKKKELEDGEEELLENEQKLAKERSDAYKEIADAEEEINDIEMAQWYVRDRTTLSGYANVKSDAACIESVGRVFPIIFFIVAILIGLTTITRMVEEERGLIGTYKALGFSDREIRKKYLVYTIGASMLGGIIGDICGFLVLPKIIFIIFAVLYQFPIYMYTFDIAYGIGGAILFAGGIIGAALIACDAELRHMPATLMRPKAPKAGSRVFLEKITPIWSRLSFLNKVTARNLFRYKKRLFMTIGGIMGCTALLLCGFVIKDSVAELLAGQYSRIYHYDVMAVAGEDENETLLAYLREMLEIKEYCNLQIDSIKVKNSDGKEEAVQLFVVPDGESLENYISLEDEAGAQTELREDGILITQNAANILNFDANDIVYLQNLELIQKEVKVSGLITNYLGNNIYMTQRVYEELFGEYQPNGVLLNLEDSCKDTIAWADQLGSKEGILSCESVEDKREQFEMAFYLINVVVYIIIIMAAGLALVVLFTLASTNISERERELATIKVLGFYDKEVHLYVNKETLILTGIGIVLGLPIGRFLGGCLTNALNMPSIYFAVTIHFVSYVITVALSIGFALIVDFLTDKTLDYIDPVEALKSIE